MSINSEALTLVLSRRLAIVDGRNQQEAMIHTARRLRAETRNRDTYESLGIFLSAAPAERQKVVDMSERMFLNA
jgi:hypothetical protein